MQGGYERAHTEPHGIGVLYFSAQHLAANYESGCLRCCRGLSTGMRAGGDALPRAARKACRAGRVAQRVPLGGQRRKAGEPRELSQLHSLLWAEIANVKSAIAAIVKAQLPQLQSAIVKHKKYAVLARLRASQACRTNGSNGGEGTLMQPSARLYGCINLSSKNLRTSLKEVPN